MATAIAVAAPIVGTPGTAHAAVPGVAQNYSKLMYRSLTVDATKAALRKTLTVQKAALKTRTTEVTAATRADAAARKKLADVTTAHAAVHERLKTAERGLSDTKNRLARAKKQRPRSKKAVTSATKAVTSATATRDARRKRLHEAATVLRAAKAQARTAATGLQKAAAVRQAAAAAIPKTEQRIATAGTAAGFAAQATTLSRDVVTEIRPKFALADTTTVYGTTVHRNVAYAFKRMVDDARADGVAISGGGFRTKQRQVELRKINGCPDVWTAPASSCRVPTAIPGRSLHELGLAVDVTSDGKTLTKKTKAFKWLSANAAKYGYVNLPSEAWHWSITGG
ncbi:D-alanyl-D-alanine carboxypeptidase family protein [Actinoplanes hulinensis]|uniref:D-alanyl-D-alanine carboxypeptidase family protein n=2 Tax=Actinoplanes hulinensis TaxID=1144547 RepID=A0ABS7B7S8_9ACTN|nr:D-alanyl-D-alanine carboxypeptidase family protein [Actinoplanes hulinensis]